MIMTMLSIVAIIVVKNLLKMAMMAVMMRLRKEMLLKSHLLNTVLQTPGYSNIKEESNEKAFPIRII